MRRRSFIAGVLFAFILSIATSAQGPSSAQIQSALRAFLTQPHTWTAAQTFSGGTSGGAGGTNTQVQFNSSGSLAGDAGFTYVSGTDTATLTNLISTAITGTTGTFTNLAGTLACAASLACTSVFNTEASVTTTGNITALASTTALVRMNNATLATIQGITAGVNGQRIRIVSVGAGQVNLAHLNGGAAASAQLINIATSGVTPLAAGSGVADLVYDGTSTKWRLVAHDQGAFITPAFAAGDYTGNNSMTVTVASGDVSYRKYRLSGRQVTEYIRVVTITVGGTPSTLIQVAHPNGYTFVQGNQNWARTVDNGGAVTNSRTTDIAANATAFSNGQAGANWTASTDNTQIEASVSYEVN